MAASEADALRQHAVRVKPLLLIRAEQVSKELHKTLTWTSLMSIGIGSVVGAGIFVLTGQAAAKYAGPALSLSFVVSSFACFLTGLCYAELSAAMPVTGSAYTYTYVMCGEFFAWTVGLCLTLEYLFSAAAVAVGWSGALQEFLHDLGTGLPAILATSPFIMGADDELELSGGLVNLPAMLIISFLAVLLSFGVKESARFNHTAVALKLGVLITFVAYGLHYALGTGTKQRFLANIDPFIPENTGRFGHYGISGIFRGAGAIFFAYVGFDAVCSMAAECVHPPTDLPRGLFGTLVVCTALYITVTLSLTGLMKYTYLDVDSPVIAALIYVDANIAFRWLVEIGSIAGLTSVCLVSLMSQPRLLYAIAKDGLLPKRFAEVHPKYKTPFFASRFSGVCCALLAGTMPLDFLGQLISFGTLIAFTFVCVGVLMKRKRHPDMPSPFLVPHAPALPIAGICVCLIQMFSLPPQTFRNCAVWLVLGTIAYIMYGRHHSVGVSLREPNPDTEFDANGQPVMPAETAEPNVEDSQQVPPAAKEVDVDVL